MSSSSGMTESSPRILRREWKRYKPHLPRSTSLPSLQLLPRNRPLFTCQRCGFSNTLIPICLWCAWTSEPAKTDFERSTPRITRRASAPTQVSWRESSTRQSGASSPPAAHHSSITTGARNIAGVNLPISLHKLETKRVADDSRNSTSGPHQDHRLGGSHADIYLGQGTQPSDGHTDQVVTATTYTVPLPNVQAQSRSRSPVGTRNITIESSTRIRSRHRRQISPVIMNFDHQSPPSSPGVDRPHDVNTKSIMKLSSTKSLRSVSSHIIVDLTNDTARVAMHHTSSSPILGPPGQQRTLRRKKGLQALKEKISSTSMRSPTRASAPPCPSPHRNSEEAIFVPQRPQSCFTSLSPPPQSSVTFDNNTVRLGHPSRPYYTAIRKNMSPASIHSSGSRPTSPHTSFLSRASSPAPSSSLLTPTSFLDIPLDDTDNLPLSFTLTPPPSGRFSHRQSHSLPSFAFAAHKSGFSVSGETEMRMTLAMEGSTDGGYKFRDNGKKTLKGHVKKMSKELKDLIFRRN